MGREGYSGPIYAPVELPQEMIAPVQHETQTASTEDIAEVNHEQVEESIRYMHGIWPEMTHALLLEMKRSGKGLLDRHRAKKLLMSNSERVFNEAALRFQRLSPDIRAEQPDGMGVTERERIAFQLFESLLSANGFLTKTGQITVGLSEEDKAAVRDLVSPETYTKLEEKLQEEKNEIAFLDTNISEPEER